MENRSKSGHGYDPLLFHQGSVAIFQLWGEDRSADPLIRGVSESQNRIEDEGQEDKTHRKSTPFIEGLGKSNRHDDRKDNI
ncbi:MAG: hypothetical protein KKG09_00420 [Verrucomicrobia bacterium]|nr:hypothetical protein [Verrucomicrobiota bacterium]MBU4248088.1 hypothetical protein [Verrucomicrobiota bacterium]MBU4428633.1 hypothetical protein [Verrucomicrobiota bacterium]MBU4496455.1 hypothetical protein [Verrucomicrobiota bacterium]